MRGARVAVGLLLTCALSPVSFGQMTDFAPGDVQVVPRYGSVPGVRVHWTDLSPDEVAFEVESSSDGAPYSALGSVLSDTTEFFDGSADAGHWWRYRVRAVRADATASSWSESGLTSPRAQWPIHDGTRNVLHSYGTALWAGRLCFHDGVDISGAGKRVDASRGGRVAQVTPASCGRVRIDIDVGGGSDENDYYAHIDYDQVGLLAGYNAVPGDELGSVVTACPKWFFTSQEALHLHFGSKVFNSLDRFADGLDRDPQGAAPEVADIDADGADLLVVDESDPATIRDPAWGGVDLIVDAYDDMFAGTNLMVAPFSLAYWIDGPAGNDVGGSSSPYVLLEFDFSIYTCGISHDDLAPAVYKPKPADLGGIDTWQTYLSWVLTNTKGATGTRGSVDATQFWRTDARMGTITAPNGSDAQVARDVQEAAFPDGSYVLHVLLRDLGSAAPHDHTRTILVDNFRPYVRKVVVRSGTETVYQAEWNWNGVSEILVATPSALDDAILDDAGRTQDLSFAVEFSEPMASASLSISPLGETVALSAADPTDARIWGGSLGAAAISDGGADDGQHALAIEGADLTGNCLYGITSWSTSDPAKRSAPGTMCTGSSTDTIHAFRIDDTNSAWFQFWGALLLTLVLIVGWVFVRRQPRRAARYSL